MLDSRDELIEQEISRYIENTYRTPLAEVLLPNVLSDLQQNELEGLHNLFGRGCSPLASPSSLFSLPALMVPIS